MRSLAIGAIVAGLVALPLTAQPLEEPRDVARPERSNRDQLHGILELIEHHVELL